MFKDQEDIMLFTIPGQYSLKEESARPVWNPLFSSFMETITKPDRDRGIVHYTSINRLLTSYLEKTDKLATFSKKTMSL